MNDTLTNKLASFQATLAVVDSDEFRDLWTGQPPIAFANGIGVVRTRVAALASKGAQQSQTTTGGTDALRRLRSRFEMKLHPLARATYRCLLALHREQDAATVDFTPSQLHDARAQALAGMGETVLDLAEPLVAEQASLAESYGLTPDSTAALDALWQSYSTAIGAPVSARARRKAMTEQLPAEFAAVEALFAGLDDLVVQFDDLDPDTGAGGIGHQFVEAWFNARRTIDLGRRAARPAPASAPTLRQRRLRSSISCRKQSPRT